MGKFQLNLLLAFTVATLNACLSPTPKSETAASKAGGQYIVNGDGTITDTKSGLMWKQCAEGLNGADCSQGKADNTNWEEAMQLAKQRTRFAGYDNWRMPTLDELQTLVQCRDGTPQNIALQQGCRDKEQNNRVGYPQFPTINTQAFPNTAVTSFWSSSSTPARDYGASIAFYAGTSSYGFGGGQIRLVRSEPPISHYIDNKNGTVTDTKTGLMWKQCAEGMTFANKGIGCYNSAKPYKWTAAMAELTNSSYAGYHDWRLPSIEELHSLVTCSNGTVMKTATEREDGCGGKKERLGKYERPTVDQVAFPDTLPDKFYWSSTSVAGDEALPDGKAKYVYFFYGSVNSVHKFDGNGRVMLVRGGKR